MPMVTVSLSPEQAARIRTAVESGAYASGSEVVREALRLWCNSGGRVDEAAGRHAGDQDESQREGTNVAELYAAYRARSSGCG